MVDIVSSFRYKREQRTVVFTLKASKSFQKALIGLLFEIYPAAPFSQLHV